MSTTGGRTFSSQVLPGKAAGRLGAMLRQLGMSLSVCDAEGRPTGPPAPACEFCRILHEAGNECEHACLQLTERVLDSQEAATGRSADGCCVLGVPIRRRRKLLGAAVACFPVRQMLDEEAMARLCDRRGLDCQAVETIARREVRHGAEDIEDLLHVLEWLLTHEQSEAVSKDELANLSANLATTYEELLLLYRISGSMRVTRQPEEFLQTVCNELLEVMNIEVAVAVVYEHAPVIEEDRVVIAGRTNLSADRMKVLAMRHVAPRFGQDNRPIVDNNFEPRRAEVFGGQVRNLVAVPLVSDEVVIGMLLGLNKAAGDFDSVDLKLIGAIGSQSGVFLTNNYLYAGMQDLLLGVLHALTATIDAKDPYTCGHSHRVAMISRRLAEECGFGPEKVQQVYLAGLLHDIGKIGVPEATLRKEGRLSQEEYHDMQRHPVIGAKILGGIRQLDDIIVGILGHHERPDGKGYPRGLKGMECPIEGLIVGLADCLDAMTSDRTYRKAMSVHLAMAEIREHAGKQFDAGLVDRLSAMDLEEFMKEIHQPTQTVFPFNLHDGREANE